MPYTTNDLFSTVNKWYPKPEINVVNFATKTGWTAVTTLEIMTANFVNYHLNQTAEKSKPHATTKTPGNTARNNTLCDTARN